MTAPAAHLNRIRSLAGQKLPPLLLSTALLLGSTAAASTTLVSLTQHEQAWIASHPKVKMCVDPDWAPFERLDEHGRHEGIGADLVQLVARRVGLTIEALPVHSWEESLAASKAGHCQVMSLLNRTPQRETWLQFTDPLFTDPNVLIAREEHPFVTNLQALGGARIAVPKGTMVEERIRQDFPQLQVVLTDNDEQAIGLVTDRKVDMTLRSLIVAAYTIKKEGHFNLKIAGHLPAYTNTLRMGVLKEEDTLRKILDKGIQTITPHEKELIANKHVSIQVRQDMDHSLVWKLLVGFAVVLFTVVFWYRKLRTLDRARAQLAEERVDQELRAKRDQSQLLAMLSHEVRTSLAIIDASAQSLRMLTPTDKPDSLLRIERIREGVKRLTHLTQQFLDKDRVEDHSLTPQLTDTDVAELCRELIHLHDDSARVVLTRSGNTHALADPFLLEVALRNLMLNALKYGPAHTPVMLSVVGHPHTIELAISNQGPSIEPQDRPTIFNIYVRGSNARHTAGSGLGLYLVKRVLGLHGGSIEWAPTADQGTTFRISLPREPQNLPQADPTGQGAPAPPGLTAKQ